MNINVFVKNPVIPDYHVALVVKHSAGPETIWIGRMEDIPEDEFNRADEAHVNDWTYALIATKAEATGKGTPIH